MKSKIWYGIGAFVASVALVVTSSLVVYPAITQLVGLAVATNATTWNNVQDAAAGDTLSSGILAASIAMFNGTTFDRLRGSITNGILVDVTRITGSVTPADGFANPTTFLGTFSLAGIFNGTTWDRWRGQTTPVQGITLLNQRATSAVNTTLTVTLSGVASQRIHLYKLTGDCTNGLSFFQVLDGATLIYQNSGVAALPAETEVEWATGLTATTGNNMVVQMGGCGAGGVASVSIEADRF